MANIKGKKGFQAGASGNPKGRPAGVATVAKLRSKIEPHIPALLDVLMSKAMSGDIGAAKLLLERILPPLKPAEQPQVINLPADGLTAQGQALLAAIASGELGASSGAALIGAVSSLGRVIEIDELGRRLAALEKGNT